MRTNAERANAESFGLLSAVVLQKSGGEAEGRREASMAAAEDRMLSVINCSVRNWEDWKNEFSPSFCLSLGRILEWACSKLLIL